MKVKPKLYLNMSPQTAEDGSLAFARNMKIDDDGNLVSDYGYKNISSMASYNIVGHIVGLDNKIYFFCANNNNGSWINSKIVEYNETNSNKTELSTTWQYSGGEIDGYVSTNQSGEEILTIGEYLDPNDADFKEIPIKHINLKYANVEQSLYSQAPKVPTANLVLDETYVKTIPNGVYVFFIRYKIRKDVYTNWFLCSRPIFGGTSESIITLQGGLKYVNLHKDSAKSFVFKLNFAQKANITYYKEFQLGFIITHDEATDARTWKHFDMTKFSTNGGTIYFDYENVEEANIDDLLQTTYELYNVRNITSFKNKLYISNYIESDFNLSVQSLTSYIDVLPKVIDGDATQTEYNDENLILSNTYKLVNFSDAYKCFVSGRYNGNNTSLDTLINTYISSNGIENFLDIDISDFYKEETVEVEDILNITYFGDVGEDPDIIYAHNLENNLYNKVIFENDYTRTYHSTGNQWQDVGLVCSGYPGLAAVYSVSNYANNPHPWYNNKNLPIGFGVFGNDDEYIPPASQALAKGNIIIINKTSLDSGNCAAGGRFYESYIRSDVAKFVKKAIEDKSRFIMGYATIYSGVKEYVIVLSNNVSKAIFQSNNYVGNDDPSYYFDIQDKNNSSASDIKNAMLNELKYVLSTYLVGIDDNGNLTLNISGDVVKANNITFTFKACEFIVDNGSEISTNDNEIYNVKFTASLKATTYNCLITYSIKSSKLYITAPSYSNDIYKQQSTLMPETSYGIYVHFVDNRNIITNGIYLKDISGQSLSLSQTTAKIILKYRLSSVPSDLTNKYKSFFLSLDKRGPEHIECFGYTKIGDLHIVQVIEADALLYNLNDNIEIVTSGDTNITSDAKYYSSGESVPMLAFGNCGFVAWKGSGDYATYKLYIKINYSNNNKESLKLVKATPYIPLESNTSSYVDIEDGFYGSYFCSVKKPSFELSSQCYVSGNDVYSAERGVTISLKDFNQYVNSQDSITYFVRSNFNLNYLSLTQDITDKIYKIGDIKQVKKTIDSATLSYIYELKSMYKDFMNKYFTNYHAENKVKFDNTIRVSHVLSDETFNNSIFKFEATDYYNVPTDKGIIINLFSIGNAIFVHCESSFYKFDGNQTIAASNTDITLQESEPFNIGITQLFDSEYGYGGINNKEAGCITFDSYLFYDAMSNHIFAYGGNNQIQLIDASIYKLLCYYKPTYCRTLHDDVNHRVFFEFTTNKTSGTYKTFTISYNYKAKSFVSLHDLSLENAFHSRYLSYSYKNNGQLNKLIRLFDTENTYTHQETIDEESVDVTTQIDVTPLVPAMNIYKIYGNATTVCFIQFGADTQEVQSSPFNIAVVIFPKESYREAFNNLKYMGDIIQDNYDEKTNYEVIKFPQITRTNPVSKFYVVTDRCVSTPVTGDVNDAQRPANPDDYKGFKYDMGSWNTNYFRNAINTTNIYQYPNQPGTNIPVSGGETYTRNPNTDNNSLVYGKYFILVFNFINDTPIKFEEVSVNSNQY